MASPAHAEPTSMRDHPLTLDRVPEPAEVDTLAAIVRRAWGVPPRAKLALDPLCERLGVELKVAPLEVPAGGAQGFLNPRPGGFLLEVDPEPRRGWSSVPPSIRAQLARQRTRFLAAHELAHTLFYERGPVPRRKLAGSAREEAAMMLPTDAHPTAEIGGNGFLLLRGDAAMHEHVGSPKPAVGVVDVAATTGATALVV